MSNNENLIKFILTFFNFHYVRCILLFILQIEVTTWGFVPDWFYKPFLRIYFPLLTSTLIIWKRKEKIFTAVLWSRWKGLPLSPIIPFGDTKRILMSSRKLENVTEMLRNPRWANDTMLWDPVIVVGANRQWRDEGEIVQHYNLEYT